MQILQKLFGDKRTHGTPGQENPGPTIDAEQENAPENETTPEGVLGPLAVRYDRGVEITICPDYIDRALATSTACEE